MTRRVGSPAYRGRTSTQGASWGQPRRLRGCSTTREPWLIDTCTSQDETQSRTMRVAGAVGPRLSNSWSDIVLGAQPIPWCGLRHDKVVVWEY